MNKKVIALSVIALVIIGLIAGASYAFFSNGEKGEENEITSGTMSLSYTDGREIVLENIVPGQIVEKEFKVKNTGDVATRYDVYLSEVENEFVDKSDLVYELVSQDGGYSTTSDIELPSVATKIVNQQLINPNEEHNYKLRIKFLNKVENQNDNMNRYFMAKLQINNYSDINTVVKYYVDNEEVAQLPNKSGVIYLNSTCNQNARITFDENTWTYNLSNINQNNTVCNIYFERDEVTITYNAGVGSVKPSSEAVTYGGYATLPIPTSPDTYYFDGWYTEENGQGTKIDNTTPVTSNMTLYAHYLVNLIDYYGRTRGYPSNLTMSNTTKRIWDTNTYIVGMAPNNYYVSTSYNERIAGFSVTNTRISISSNCTYSIAFPMILSPDKQYQYLDDYAYRPANIYLSYYKSDGSHISYSNIVSGDIFSPPSDSYYALYEIFGNGTCGSNASNYVDNPRIIEVNQ